MNTESKEKISLSRFLSPNILLGVFSVLFAASTIGFFLFGIVAGQLNFLLTNWVETSIRFAFAAVSVLVAIASLKGAKEWLLISWQLLLLVFHFVVFPLQIISGTDISWNDLVNLGSPNQITGFETLDFLMGVSIIGSIVILLLNEKARASLNIDAGLRVLRGGVERRFKLFVASNLFVKITGLGVATWAIINVVLFVMGIAFGVVKFETTLPPVLIDLSAALLLLGLILFSNWSRTHVLWATISLVLWIYFLQPQLVGVERFSYVTTLFGALPDAMGLLAFIQSVSLWVVFLGLVGIFLERIVNAYANRVKSWIDNRIAEIYSDEIVGRVVDGPRTTSLLAVVSVFFAFTVPIIGLIFAHAARNEIAISRGAKLGTDLTVIAGVVSWLFMFVYALLFFVFFIAQPLIGDPYWWLSLLSTFGQ